MSKKIVMFCALAFVVAFAAAAYAEVQNVRIGGDITVYGIYRDEYDLDDRVEDATNDADDAAFYTSIARVKVDADLTDNVQATFRLLNERVWGGEDAQNTDVDLDLAFITLNEMLYSPLTLTIGRQNLRFGNALIVGDPNTNAQTARRTGLDRTLAEDLSARKSFDALRATLDYDPLTIDLIAAKISEVDQRGDLELGSAVEDEDLLGINVAYKLDDYNAATEAYFFAKDADTEFDLDGYIVNNIVPLTRGGDIYNLGLCASLEPIDGLTLKGEIAHQFGEAQNREGRSRDQSAWAFDLGGSFAFDNAYAPILGLGYAYRSGQDVTRTTGDYEAWNPMYEDQTHGVIADYIFSGVNGGVNSNASIIKAYGSIKPLEDITLTAKYYNYRLAERLVTENNEFVTYPNLGGITGRNLYMRTSKELGDAIDLSATYDYTEDVQFGLTAAWFFPGEALDGRGEGGAGVKVNDDAATAILGSVRLVF